MKRLGILLSGRGSNCLAIHRAIQDGRIPHTEISVVLSNRADAAGLDAARAAGLTADAIVQQGKGADARAQHDAEMIVALRESEVDLVCLAGYMRIISPAFVAAFRDRILNVHPSLLPSFPGLEAQNQALAFGVKVAGCTVHFVDEQVDHGVIVMQRAVAVEDSDTAYSLAQRILEEEHTIYPEAIARVLSGRYRIDGRRFIAG
jgi:phosphoribosylglycinamide formyltransferase-1